MALTQNIVPAAISLAGNPIYVSYSTDKIAEDFIGIHLSVYVFLNATWVLLGNEMRYEPDATGKIEVDIHSLLEWGPLKEVSWPNKLVDLITLHTDLTRLYKIEVSEKYGNPLTEDDTDTVSNLRILSGSISKLKLGLLNDEISTWLAEHTTENKFLTNSPRIKKTDAWASERLYFLQLPTAALYDINLNIKINYTDGTSDSLIRETFLEASQNNVYEIITSYSTLGLYLQNTSKIVEKYEVWITNSIAEVISESFTYTLDHIRKSETRYFIFSNAHKVMEGLRFTGKSKNTSEYSYQQSKRTLQKDYSLSDPSMIKSNSMETQSIETNSDWLSLAEMNWIRELLLSEEVYEIVNGHMIPILIETSDVNINEDITNLRSLKIKYSYAHADRVPILLPEIDYGLWTKIVPNISKQLYTSLADTGLNSIMMPRVCINPINGTIVEIFRIASTHVGTAGSIYMRVSTDSGLTWTGVGGVGNITEIFEETSVDLRNIGAIYTPTGRLIVIYMRYDYSVPVFLDTKYIYSDNDGLSWSAPIVFAAPGVELNRFPAPYGNRCVVDASGNLLFPFHYTEGSGTGTKIYLAKSADNGATWDTDYKLILNTFSTSYLVSEPVIEDLGNGNFVVICRSSSQNTAGYEVPLICYSSDYGEHWAGAGETLSRTNLDNGDFNSGYLYLEGAGVTLGQGTSPTNCLPDVIRMTINGEDYIVIPYWIRNNGIETYIQKMTLIKVSDFITNGVNAVKSPLTIVLFDGLNTLNGGNGAGIIIGNKILYTTSEQTVTYTGGVMNLYTFFIDNSILNALAVNYNLI